MARKFSGGQKLTLATSGLAVSSMMTVALWAYSDANNTTAAKIAEYGAETTDNGWVIEPNSSAGAFKIGMFKAGAADYWLDKFTWPTAAAWHHYMFIFDRTGGAGGNPQNFAYVDGVLQTLTTHFHSGSAYGNFGSNKQLIVGANYGGGGDFFNGRVAEMTIWNQNALTAQMAKSLATGAPPEFCVPGARDLRAPLQGVDSPEPEYSGNRKTFTVSGATWVQHPPVMPGMLVAA